MRRYWIEPEKLNEERAEIEGDLLHHLFDVCRLEMGSRFELIKGDQRAYLVELVSRTKKTALAKVLSYRDVESIPRPYLHLAISIPRFQKLDFIFEKAVELGAKRVTPFVSDYSFVRKLEEIKDNKAERWERIITAGTQQCGRGDRMELGVPATLRGLLEELSPHWANPNGSMKGLFLYEGASTLDLKQALERIKPTQPQELVIFVGSEGGFSRQELEMFETRGLQPVTFGAQVLRVETACMAILSILKYELNS